MSRTQRTYTTHSLIVTYQYLYVVQEDYIICTNIYTLCYQVQTPDVTRTQRTYTTLSLIVTYQYLYIVREDYINIYIVREDYINNYTFCYQVQTPDMSRTQRTYTTHSLLVTYQYLYVVQEDYIICTNIYILLICTFCYQVQTPDMSRTQRTYTTHSLIVTYQYLYIVWEESLVREDYINIYTLCRKIGYILYIVLPGPDPRYESHTAHLHDPLPHSDVSISLHSTGGLHSLASAHLRNRSVNETTV